MLHFDRAFIIRNGNGTFSIVGRVPLACMTRRAATREDVMGGRAQYEGEGAARELVAYVGRAFATVEEATDALEACGAPFEPWPRT
jgi:hypothetical protein